MGAAMGEGALSSPNPTVHTAPVHTLGSTTGWIVCMVVGTNHFQMFLAVCTVVGENILEVLLAVLTVVGENILEFKFSVEDQFFSHTLL